jgi:hypothetical protein
MTIDRIERIRQRAHELWVGEGPAPCQGHRILAARRAGDHRCRGDAGVRRGRTGERGRGNRTAARAFDREQTAFVQHENVEPRARQAEEALEGPEGEQLRRAEQEGRSRSRGEDPALQPSAAADSNPAKPRRSPSKSASKG